MSQTLCAVRRCCTTLCANGFTFDSITRTSLVRQGLNFFQKTPPMQSTALVLLALLPAAAVATLVEQCEMVVGGVMAPLLHRHHTEPSHPLRPMP